MDKQSKDKKSLLEVEREFQKFDKQILEEKNEGRRTDYENISKGIENLRK